MSQLTSRPWPELQKLSSDLENMAFTKANGNQVSYLALYCLTDTPLRAAALTLQSCFSVTVKYRTKTYALCQVSRQSPA